MVFPNNGKVVIIDDEPKDVEELMVALTKEKMPFLFFKDRGGNDLPDTPINNIRLLFLDLDLGIGGTEPTEKIRIVQQRIYSILEPKTPYVLVIWSTHEDRYTKTLLDEFSNGFSDYKPIAHCSLDKSIIKNKEINVVDTIRQNLKEQLSAFNSFNAFLLWECIVNTSGGEIVNDFTKIFDFNDHWDNNIKAFFFRLAKANVGDVKVNEISDDEKLRLALQTITLALVDTIEKNIKASSKLLDLKNIKEEKATITPNNLTAINTKLHLLKSDVLDHFHPGNLYFLDFYEDTVQSIVPETFDKKVVEEIIATKPKLVRVDLTPICDYAQDKGYTRMLTGIIIDGKYRDKKKSPSKLFIYDLCPSLDMDGGQFYIVFDFRTLKTFRKNMVKEGFSTPKYRFRTQLVNDLQAGVSNHINRPGIVSIL